MTEFTAKVIEIIKNIPAGKIMTYGQIAAIGGNPRGARQVSRILHSMGKKYQLPWHRVINSKGEISLGGIVGKMQKEMLEHEGVTFNLKGKINLEEYMYNSSIEN